MQGQREADRVGGLPRRLLRALAALVAVVVAAGCAGDQRLSKSEYEQEVQSVYADVRRAFLATGQSSTSPQDLAARVETARESLNDGADKLDDVQPPRELLEVHQELVLGMRGYATDLEKLQRYAKTGDAEGIKRFNQAVATNPSVLRIAEAAEEMIHRGYDLGQLDPE